LLEGKTTAAPRPSAPVSRANSSPPTTTPTAAPRPAETLRNAPEPVLDLRLSVPPVVLEDESLPAEPWERFLAVLRKKAPWAASS